MIEIDGKLAIAWDLGVFGSDAGEWRVLADLNSGHPRAAEVRAFATLAMLIARELPSSCPAGPLADPAAGASAEAVGHAAHAWRAAAEGAGREASQALGAVEKALARAATGPHDPRLPAARAWADLAVSECARIAGDEETALRRLDALLAGRPPDAVALIARKWLANTPLGSLANASARARLLEETVHLGERLGRPQEVVEERVKGALMLMLAGQTDGAAARLRGLVASPTLPDHLRALSQLLLAMTAPGDQVFVELAEGLRLVASEGDYLGYVTLISVGARLYAKRGHDVEAVATISTGIAQLERSGPQGPEMARPLHEERVRLHAEMGEERWEKAARALLAQMDGERDG